MKGSMSGASAPVHAMLWRRLAARILDYLAMFWWLFAMQIIGVTFWVDSSTTAFVTIAAFYAVLEVVYVAKRGQTPAKELLKIRVVSTEGTVPPGWGVALRRWVMPGLALALPIWIVPIALAVLGLPALFDPQRRTLYDRLARTVVMPYDAKAVEGPVRSRRQLVRNPMDRNIAAVAAQPELLSEEED